MGVELITNELIEKLIKMRKVIQNPNVQFKNKERHQEKNFELQGEDGYAFLLYLRQNKFPGMADDFSSGLSWSMPSGQSFTLTRYNGNSHNHLNHLEKERLGYVCHIHRASEEYILAGKKADGFAIPTNRYYTLDGALHCLIHDCNIFGIETKPDLPNLFINQ